MSQTPAPALSQPPGTASRSVTAPPEGWVRVVTEVVVAMAITVVLVGVLSMATGRPMRAGTAMEPAIAEGTRVWVRDGSAPQRGEVMVLSPGPEWSDEAGDQAGALTRMVRWLRLANPPAGSWALVRVVGVPGDEVRSDGHGTLRVNGLPVPAAGIERYRFRVVVPRGRYFVTTDHPSAMSSMCQVHRLGAEALPGTDRLVGRVSAVGAPWNGAASRAGAEAYTGIAGREAPPAPIIDAGKDPTC